MQAETEKERERDRERERERDGDRDIDSHSCAKFRREDSVNISVEGDMCPLVVLFCNLRCHFEYLGTHMLWFVHSAPRACAFVGVVAAYDVCTTLQKRREFLLS
jgi:hypothetical protein